jgi:hypothetical protein|tara:strand:- start:1852 stop:2112 length:261 start_codon:yes stop_codon:yes gene_type:complete
MPLLTKTQIRTITDHASSAWEFCGNVDEAIRECANDEFGIRLSRKQVDFLKGIVAGIVQKWRIEAGVDSRYRMEHASGIFTPYGKN